MQEVRGAFLRVGPPGGDSQPDGDNHPQKAEAIEVLHPGHHATASMRSARCK
jgi:hypothetical protein